MAKKKSKNQDKFLYNFCKYTREYMPPKFKPTLDPIEGSPMQPAFSTFLEPPNTKDKEVAVFSDNEFGNGKWIIKVDHRGTWWSIADGSVVEVTEIGIVPSDVTDQEWPGDFWEWDGETWIFNQTASDENDLEQTRKLIISDRMEKLAIDDLITEGILEADGSLLPENIPPEYQ